VLDISSATPFAALTMRSLSNERGDFLLTTFPIVDVDRAAPSPVVFPQIADGGGYVTQFILIGAGGASSATLNFYANEGNPLAVGTGWSTLPPARATIYYLDCSAQTAGGGTKDSPWNTLETANAFAFQPGDALLLKRGMTCSGMLVPRGSGASGSPIIIDAYGSGSRPIIDGGMNGVAILLWGLQYWEVSNLEIVGGVGKGILVGTSTDYSVLNHLYVRNLDVHGAHEQGAVYFDCSESNNSHCSDILIDGVIAHDDPLGSGIFAAGFTNITVQNSTVHDVAGNGILLMLVKDSVIQNCVAYNATGSGIAYVGCENCVMQYNESYSNKTLLPAEWDGGGFGMEVSKNGTVQYNYGHDNWGYCIAHITYPEMRSENNVFRYNVCSNNGQKSTLSFQGEFTLDDVRDPDDGVQIYNNAFYWNPAGTGPAIFLVKGRYTGENPNFFKNNIIYSAVPEMIQSTSGMSMDNNIYWTTSGYTPTWEIDGISYTGLSAFQALTGQDRHSLLADPMMLNPTYHEIGRPTTAFTLQPGSPGIGTGANVCSGVSDCSMGNRDFFGSPLPTGSGYSIGAYQPARH
jgi:hypothetical protein